MKNKDIVLKILLASVILAVFIMGLYAYISSIKKNTKHKFNNEPIITENFKSTELNKLKETTGYFYLNKLSNEIIEEFENENDYNIIGKYGKLYKTPIKIKYKENDEYDEYDENEKYGVYTIKTDDDDLYYLEDDKGNKSRKYNYIYTLDYENNNRKTTVDYLVLESDNTISLFNYRTVKETNLNAYYESLFINDGETKNGNYTKYIIAKKMIDGSIAYGLIDYEGNVILDFKYDELSNIKNSDEYKAFKDGKYGIINSKGNIIEDFIYDDYINVNNYTILIKNNKIGIRYNNKLIVDFTIPFLENDTYDLDYEVLEDNLYLFKHIKSDENSQTYWNKSITYLINKKGIEQKIDSNLEPITEYIDDDDRNITYFYKLNENNGKLLFTIYDLYLIEYYSFSVPYEKAYGYEVLFSKYNDKDLYELEIAYTVKNVKPKYQYVDLFNSKLISEKEALYNQFKNGYGFVLDYDGKLTIYKNDEIISEYNNIQYYLGGYYFCSENELYELVFNK